MNQRIIHTNRLKLRPFHNSDANAVMTLAGDARVAAPTLNVPHPYELSMALDWIGSHAGLLAQKEQIIYAITLTQTESLIGAIGLTATGESTAELGYWVGIDYWNHGYCSEAAQALIDYAFEELKLESLSARYIVGNEASGRVMQKAGLTFSKQVQAPNRDGNLSDLNLYQIVADTKSGT